MIHTLTMNPAVDMTIRSGGLRPGEVNRTRDSVYDYNGKGVNVARVLRHLGEETAALGFFGGFSGRFIVDSLRDEGIPVYPIPVEDTRNINWWGRAPGSLPTPRPSCWPCWRNCRNCNTSPSTAAFPRASGRTSMTASWRSAAAGASR